MNTDNTTPLSADELQRYARHIVLPEIGGAGQQRLKRARVLVVGAGGLGAPVLQYLAAAGIGTLGVADDDRVSLSNLQRQVIHDTDAVDRLKTQSAADSIARLNPHVSVNRHDLGCLPDNARDIMTNYDVIADGSDNFETRYMVADISAELHKPLVTGAVGRFDGFADRAETFETNGDGAANPSYRDLFPSPPPPGLVPSCAEAGILGALTGIIGSLQAMEVIKLIAGIGEPLIDDCCFTMPWPAVSRPSSTRRHQNKR